jgi:chromosome segregation ATPase
MSRSHRHSCRILSGIAVVVVASALAAALPPRPGAAQQSCSRQNEQLEAMRADLTTCKREKDKAADEKYHADTSARESRKRTEDAEHSVGELRKDLDRQVMENTGLEQQNKKLDQDNKRLLGENFVLTKDRNDADKKREEEKIRADKADANLTRANTAYGELEKARELLIKEKDALVRDRDGMKARAEKAEREKIEADGHETSALAKWDAAQRAHDETRKIVEQRDAQLTAAATDLSTKDGELRDLREQLRAANKATLEEKGRSSSSETALGKEREQARSLKTSLDACQRDIDQRNRTLVTCPPQPVCQDCREARREAEERFKRVIGNDRAYVDAWEAVAGDLKVKFADIRTAQACESFAIKLEPGESAGAKPAIILSGMLVDSRAKQARQRAQEIQRLLPNLRVEDQLQSVTECPYVIGGLRAVAREGRPRQVRWNDIERDRLDVSRLPQELECKAVVAGLLERDPEIASTAGGLRLWALDARGVPGLCERQINGEWRINRTSTYTYSGLFLTRENQ